MPEAPTNLTTLYQGALDVAYQNPLQYEVQVRADTADSAYAANIAYWQTVFPKVELRAVDNPGVDYRLLNMPWQTAWGNPPLVFLYVTPRSKPLPKTSGWLQQVGVFAPLIAVIPVVGAVVAIAVSVAAAADQAEKVKNFMGAISSVTNTEFEPQYYPHPFPVLLPLDEAQKAVADPATLPRRWDTFKHRIQEAQRAATQALIGAPSTLTLSPDTNPTVLHITAPGETPPTTDQWYKNLLAAFHRSGSPSDQYQQVQNTLLTGSPAGNPVAASVSGQTAAQNANAAGQSHEQLIWLAVAGAAAIVVTQ